MTTITFNPDVPRDNPMRQALERMEVDRLKLAMRTQYANAQYRGLTNHDHATIRGWFATRFPEGLACACGRKDGWKIEATMSTPIGVETLDGRAASVVSRLSPEIALTAECCGERRHFDAVLVGLLEIDLVPDVVIDPIKRRVALQLPAQAPKAA